MQMVVVPNELDKQINAALDAALAETPAAAPDRAYFYNELLCFFDDHGYVPEFSLAKKASQ